MSQNSELEIFEIPEDHVNKAAVVTALPAFHSINFEIIPFDETQAREALAAFDRYGKGMATISRIPTSRQVFDVSFKRVAKKLAGMSLARVRTKLACSSATGTAASPKPNDLNPRRPAPRAAGLS
jgi:hypothetical protein